ncbi:MAG: 50S ribosomal protein L23 [Fastidiosipila sp.]|nr:50S ribosomal protein L23 [Fastidiosipila sp.]
MKNPHEIIIRPVITEQSMMEAAYGKYTFEVDRRASKTEIGRAIEALFEVKVTGVNTINLRGKERRVGSGKKGMTAARKKAIVTIDSDPSDESYQTAGGKTATRSKKYKTSIEEFGFGQ